MVGKQWETGGAVVIPPDLGYGPERGGQSSAGTARRTTRGVVCGDIVDVL